ncbi:MAG: tRNA (guanosine(46)-N7)-methyltransferase TrmB [Candidatus Sericytochromatia bacterium]
MLVSEKMKSFDEIIKEDKPIDIEIGFGKGQFIVEKAKLYKDINFIGFEVKKGLVDYTISLIEKNSLSNIYVEKSYANVSIPQKIPNESIRNIYVNFPDPWWKRKHKKRRILQTDYIKIFYNSLKEDGIIYVRTDVKEYSEFVKKNFSEFKEFQEIEHDIISDNIMSNRETRCIEEGLDVYYLAFKKVTSGTMSVKLINYSSDDDLE